MDQDASAWLSPSPGDPRLRPGQTRPVPQLEITEVKEDSIRFTLSDCDVSIANTLRRVMIAEVPTLAIDIVEFEDNNSGIMDEFLAHRLGLVPLRFDGDLAREMAFPHECDCDDEDECDRCTVWLDLNVDYESLQAPRDEDLRGTSVAVTSRQLISRNERVQPAHFASAEEEDAFGQDDQGITIARLQVGQRLRLRAKATKGIAKEHAKWSPVCTATYKYEPIVEINPDVANALDEDQIDDIIESCPTEVFGKDGNGALEIVDSMKCMYCEECLQTARTFRARKDDPAAVVVRPNHNRFYFFVETDGSLRAEDVVRGAFMVIDEKLRNMASVVSVIQQKERAADNV
mmetsp:Transcript_19817/g.60060  ORF Transcript_19817/g.60060 Transcript_19817/m.60060 type:complete len:346 (-) Transcript_19817:102-1139(-)|eukprot:CAMPEP_0118850318 /NCGR_PEP_ID=MMETSP1163-20130328/229_1 /TAXON_ID=124430 /ORGANISM="Phaeomonas parva, Strain CCMP2877" /LENGTH=345 /DNA_ID=CAMNT_0006782521 /DNA_START=310 /DNA_END=1347 /DNA_ORIENTATION=+